MTRYKEIPNGQKFQFVGENLPEYLKGGPWIKRSDTFYVKADTEPSGGFAFRADPNRLVQVIP